MQCFCTDSGCLWQHFVVVISYVLFSSLTMLHCEENHLKHYETLMLIRTSATSDEIGFLEESIEKRVTKSGGTVDLFDKWGKLRLAYPVKKQEYGLYILARYSLPAEDVQKFLKDFESFLRIKCHEFIMRYANIVLEGPGSAEYKRPDAVDAAPQKRGRMFDDKNGNGNDFKRNGGKSEITPLKEAAEDISEVDDKTLGVESDLGKEAETVEAAAPKAEEPVAVEENTAEEVKS